MQEELDYEKKHWSFNLLSSAYLHSFKPCGFSPQMFLAKYRSIQIFKIY